MLKSQHAVLGAGGHLHRKNPDTMSRFPEPSGTICAVYAVI